MIDSDVAMLYHYKTKRINETVARNQERFPENFCFQLTENELENLRSQFATSSLNEKMWFQFGTTSINTNENLRFQNGTSSLKNEKWSQSATTLERENYGGRRYLPYVFTEHVIDNKELYHIGASLKDLGKKCFAISKMEDKNLIEKVVDECYQK